MFLEKNTFFKILKKIIWLRGRESASSCQQILPSMSAMARIGPGLYQELGT